MENKQPGNSEIVERLLAQVRQRAKGIVSGDISPQKPPDSRKDTTEDRMTRLSKSGRTARKSWVLREWARADGDKLCPSCNKPLNAVRFPRNPGETDEIWIVGCSKMNCPSWPQSLKVVGMIRVV